MKPPKKVYVAGQWHPDEKAMGLYASEKKTTHPDEYLYVRLTWEDIDRIISIYLDVDEKVKDACLAVTDEQVSREVYHQFMDDKNLV